MADKGWGYLIGGALIIAILICGFYPFGFSTLLQEKPTTPIPDNSTPICVFCCNLNEFFHNIGLTEDKCLVQMSGGNNYPPYTTTTWALFTTTTIGLRCENIWNPNTATCASGYCPNGQQCRHYPATLSMMERCGCATPSVTTTTNQVLCTDSDGGINQFIWGHCESSVTGTGSPDACVNVRVVREYYCKPDNTCDYMLLDCGYPLDCIAGQCIHVG